MAAPENEKTDSPSTARLDTGPGGMTLTATVVAEPSAPKDKAKTESGGFEDAPPEPVVTRHEMRLADRTLRYTVTTGTLPLRNEKDGKEEARIFFIAYTLDPEDGQPRRADRPLMFSFNGGPGSSSVWLHLGALGPKRVQMGEDGSLPPPPYRMVDNEHTWLDTTDLVFIDPVGTGFSRAENADLGKKFWGLQGDIESVGEFIRLYLTRYERWASPLFLVGESYGTTRAAGLSGHLIERGIAFNGILLVSSILNFQTARFTTGNDLPYVLFLPTYTATAWYHNRLPADLQQADLAATLAEAKQWAASAYTVALGRGNSLTPEERAEVIARLARYTGLSETFIDHADLRIEIHRFCKELLRTEKKTVGRLDSRITGRDGSAAAEHPEFDPSMTAIRPPYTAVFNDYVRTQLQYRTDLPYYILGGGITGPWDWGADNHYADTSDALRSAFAKNPYMKLFVASGYYDLATPYFATEYTLAHMGLDPEAAASITTAEYPAGHMMYIEGGSLAKLKTDVAVFLAAALEPTG